ncbi:uncharacterized protein DNG_10380 [Cephalotrichum gorgonifer]|uniref:Uncharacterized protein n=1 Tax=Cephalotrichum gorgonifer TaxID=2041049 RepID=A0AAE8N7H6_9PEZI|nr:uncharacterized protein DNG_10380 [Cephalotrichum gorgonifer]
MRRFIEPDDPEVLLIKWIFSSFISLVEFSISLVLIFLLFFFLVYSFTTLLPAITHTLTPSICTSICTIFILHFLIAFWLIVALLQEVGRISARLPGFLRVCFLKIGSFVSGLWDSRLWKREYVPPASKVKLAEDRLSEEDRVKLYELKNQLRKMCPGTLILHTVHKDEDYVREPIGTVVNFIYHTKNRQKYEAERELEKKLREKENKEREKEEEEWQKLKRSSRPLYFAEGMRALRRKAGTPLLPTPTRSMPIQRAPGRQPRADTEVPSKRTIALRAFLDVKFKAAKEAQLRLMARRKMERETREEEAAERAFHEQLALKEALLQKKAADDAFREMLAAEREFHEKEAANKKALLEQKAAEHAQRAEQKAADDARKAKQKAAEDARKAQQKAVNDALKSTQQAANEARKAQKKADKDARKAQLKAAKDARKAKQKAANEARKPEQKAVDKARKVEQEAMREEDLRRSQSFSRDDMWAEPKTPEPMPYFSSPAQEQASPPLQAEMDLDLPDVFENMVICETPDASPVGSPMAGVTITSPDAEMDIDMDFKLTEEMVGAATTMEVDSPLPSYPFPASPFPSMVSGGPDILRPEYLPRPAPASTAMEVDVDMVPTQYGTGTSRNFNASRQPGRQPYAAMEVDEDMVPMQVGTQTIRNFSPPRQPGYQPSAAMEVDKDFVPERAVEVPEAPVEAPQDLCTTQGFPTAPSPKPSHEPSSATDVPSRGSAKTPKARTKGLDTAPDTNVRRNVNVPGRISMIYNPVDQIPGPNHLKGDGVGSLGNNPTGPATPSMSQRFNPGVSQSRTGFVFGQSEGQEHQQQFSFSQGQGQQQLPQLPVFNFGQTQVQQLQKQQQQQLSTPAPAWPATPSYHQSGFDQKHQPPGDRPQPKAAGTGPRPASNYQPPSVTDEELSETDRFFAGLDKEIGNDAHDSEPAGQVSRHSSAVATAGKGEMPESHSEFMKASETEPVSHQANTPTSGPYHDPTMDQEQESDLSDYSSNHGVGPTDKSNASPAVPTDGRIFNMGYTLDTNDITTIRACLTAGINGVLQRYGLKGPGTGNYGLGIVEATALDKKLRQELEGETTSDGVDDSVATFLYEAWDTLKTATKKRGPVIKETHALGEFTTFSESCVRETKVYLQARGMALLLYKGRS